MEVHGYISLMPTHCQEHLKVCPTAALASRELGTGGVSAAGSPVSSHSGTTCTYSSISTITYIHVSALP